MTTVQTAFNGTHGTWPKHTADDPAAFTAIIQMVRALARRQARIDARVLEAANDNRRLQ
jgi:hypothetical protein